LDPIDLPTEAFRKYGHEMIDWIAEYLEDPTQYPVLSQSHPSYFAYFAISSSVPGILGELLAAAPC